jgi:hypothetical protein
MKWIKKLGCLCTAVILATGIGTIPSYAIMDQEVYEIPLGQGMTLKKINEVYDYGVQKINIVTADLNNPNIKLDLLFNKNGIAKRGKLSSMVQQESNVVAAMNADFFSMASSSFSIGAMMKDGKQLSTPHYQPNTFGTVLVDSNQKVAIQYIKSGTYLNNTSKGVMTVANSINKPNGAGKGVIVYTSEYRPTTLGVNGTRPNLVEVIVKQGIVTDVRVAQPATYIPTDGYAIISDTASGRDLAKRFSVGDTVELKTEITMNYPDTQMAVGGGSLLIKDGVATTINKKVSGKSQRSALAVTSDNKVLFVTVDGRGMDGAIGMTEAQLQQFLLAQNVKDAIVFDGGGSTELIVDSKVENKITAERPVINGVSLKNNAQKGSPTSVKIVPLAGLFVQGEKVPVAIKVFDANDNMLTSSSVSVFTQGVSGNYDGRNMVFTSGGSGQIVAQSGGASNSIAVEVIGTSYNDPRKTTNLQSPTFVMVTDTSSQQGDVATQAISVKLQQELAQVPNVVMLGNRDRSFTTRGNTVSFENGQVQTVGNTSFLLMDGSNGSLSGQWDIIEYALKQPTSNLVICMNSKLQVSGNSLDIFRKKVHQAAKTKNIYLVEKKGEFSSYQEGNISRISVKDLNAPSSKLSDIKYLAFQENNGALQYEFKTLFQ